MINIKQFKRVIESDVDLLFSLMQKEMIENQDRERIKDLINCRIACLSHQIHVSRKGHPYINHNQRNEIRDVLRNHLEDYIDLKLGITDVKRIQKEIS